MPTSVVGLTFCPFLIIHTTDRASTDLTIWPRAEARTKAVPVRGSKSIHAGRDARNAEIAVKVPKASNVAYSPALTEKPKARIEEPTYKDE